MANKRFTDNPELSALVGSEVLPATAVDGGSDAGGNAISPGTDVKIKLLDALGLRVTVVAVTGGTATVDCGRGLNRNHTLSLTGNTTLSLSNLAPSGYATEGEIRVSQDVTGGRTLALPASFKPLGGSDTAVKSAANAVTVLSYKTMNDGVSVEYAMQESA